MLLIHSEIVLYEVYTLCAVPRRPEIIAGDALLDMHCRICRTYKLLDDTYSTYVQQKQHLLGHYLTGYEKTSSLVCKPTSSVLCTSYLSRVQRAKSCISS